MKQLALFISLLLVSAQAKAAEPEQSAEVMLFGVFHFANPGQDVVRTDQIDVMSPENQAYLEALASRIGRFNPTVVLLEYDSRQDQKVQNQYDQYLDGGFELPSNEIYQLGFRIASISDADTVHGFDETAIGWQAGPLFEYLRNHDTDTDASLAAMIAAVTQDENDAQSSLSLRELLIRTNTSERDALNRSFYLLTNAAGDDDNFVGADAAASWWHRNFRMYARIQRFAQPGERVLVIAGQGHTAIFRRFLDDDPDRIAVDVMEYL